MPELVLPSAAHRDSFLDACAEIRATDRPEWREAHIDATNVDAHLQALADFAVGKNLPDGFVPATEYWLVEGSHWLGRVDVRHRLTPALEQYGGHIGYIIRPSERGKGYGNRILPMALAKAKGLGLDRVLVTCRESNIGSRRIIERNGGVYQDSVPRADGDGDTRRYWITL